MDNSLDDLVVMSDKSPLNIDDLSKFLQTKLEKVSEGRQQTISIDDIAFKLPNLVPIVIFIHMILGKSEDARGLSDVMRRSRTNNSSFEVVRAVLSLVKPQNHWLVPN